MSATILFPLQGDTVTNPVTVSSGYDAAATFLLTTTVGGVPDNGKSVTVPPTSGTTNSNAVTASVGYPKTVTVTPGDGSSGDSQSNITVNPSGTPPPISVTFGNVVLLKGNANKTIKLDGSVSAASTALFVVAQVLEVNLQAKTRTAVALGIDQVKNNKKWKIDLTYPTVAGRKYVLHLFGLDVNFNRVNSVSGPIP